MTVSRWHIMVLTIFRYSRSMFKIKIYFKKAKSDLRSLSNVSEIVATCTTALSLKTTFCLLPQQLLQHDLLTSNLQELKRAVAPTSWRRSRFVRALLRYRSTSLTARYSVSWFNSKFSWISTNQSTSTARIPGARSDCHVR